MTIWRNLANALVVPEIRNRILFVFGAFAIFVIMVHVQIPWVDIAKWQTILNNGQFLNFLGFLSGGALQRFSVIAMGITPYINASIIMQLATVVFPEVKELMQHGGEEGRKRVGLWTRWLTVVLALLQATTMVIALNKAGVFLRTDIFYLVMVVLTLTAGTIWLMWLGEQITDRGIGNGVSLIIFVGIILRYPTYFSQTLALGEKGALPFIGVAIFIIIAAISLISIIFMYPGPATRPRPICASRGGSQGLRRPEHLHPAAPQQRGRHLDHLRDLDPALPAADRIVGWTERRGVDARLQRLHDAVLQLRRCAVQRRVLLARRRVHVLL